ncbi:transcriptional regulator, Nlp family [Photorhabdus aegyptia]|uniref:Transcriptional regulator, Nlp family n=1 Tax=Photorhabdus aegyptia TaxID=2805098 RepID=A0A022PCH3_9GAMM|nr:transcriptional regulator, Nlp family [Photorhabdus aegyptia]
MQTNKQQEDWHPTDIIAALKKRGTTLAAVSRKVGLAPSTLNNALIRHYPKGEKIIASELDLHPSDIWPSRYQKQTNQNECSTPNVVTQKATRIDGDHELRDINTSSMIKQIQIDAENALVEKIGDMFDVATSHNEKNAIGQTYCLLKYGILPFLRDATVMSERNKMLGPRC